MSQEKSNISAVHIILAIIIKCLESKTCQKKNFFIQFILLVWVDASAAAILVVSEQTKQLSREIIF